MASNHKVEAVVFFQLSICVNHNMHVVAFLKVVRGFPLLSGRPFAHSKYATKRDVLSFLNTFFS